MCRTAAPLRPFLRRFAGGALCMLALLALPADDAAAQAIALTASAVRFPAPTSAHFVQGWIDLPTTSVTITPTSQGNYWTLTLRAATADLGGKPLSDVQWRIQGNSTWNALSATDAVVLVERRTTTVVMEFRMVLRWSDPPGTYQTNIVWNAFF